MNMPNQVMYSIPILLASKKSLKTKICRVGEELTSESQHAIRLFCASVFRASTQFMFSPFDLISLSLPDAQQDKAQTAKQKVINSLLVERDYSAASSLSAGPSSAMLSMGSDEPS
jgi:hypothetical protein